MTDTSGRAWAPLMVQLLAACLLLAIIGISAERIGRTRVRVNHEAWRTDFHVFHQGVLEARAGRDIYTTHNRQRLWPYLYTTFPVTLLKPLGSLPVGQAVYLWNLLQLALLLAGVELCRRLLVGLRCPQPLLISAGSVLIGVYSLRSNFEWAQVNILVTVVLLGALLAWQRGRSGIAGTLVAVAAAVKVVPLALVLVAPLGGRRRALRFAAGLLLGVLVCCWLLPGLVYGFGWTHSMLANFAELLRRTAGGREANLPWGNNCANSSLLFAFHHEFGRCADIQNHVTTLPYRLFTWIRYGLVLGTVASAALLLWRRHRDQESDLSGWWPLLAAQALIVMILANAITWYHHWVLLAPAVALLAAASLGPAMPLAGRFVGSILTLLLAVTLAAGPPQEAAQRGITAYGLLAVWVGVTGLICGLAVGYQAPTPSGIPAASKRCA